jgi:hypothetical protein
MHGNLFARRQHGGKVSPSYQCHPGLWYDISYETYGSIYHLGMLKRCYAWYQLQHYTRTMSVLGDYFSYN